VDITIAEVSPIQELDDALQVSIAQPARDLRRDHPDLFELGVAEADYLRGASLESAHFRVSRRLR
jgi:hypothetical protein